MSLPLSIFSKCCFRLRGFLSRVRELQRRPGDACLYTQDAFADVGGIASIRNALIDDCSLAEKLKTAGPIWLGLTDRARSIRPYDTLSDVKRMISRSAYAQLRYSPLLLAATAAMMALTFIAPPLLAIFATGLPRVLGLVAWLAMTISYIPTLRFYRRSALLELCLAGNCRALPVLHDQFRV